MCSCPGPDSVASSNDHGPPSPQCNPKTASTAPCTLQVECSEQRRGLKLGPSQHQSSSGDPGSKIHHLRLWNSPRFYHIVRTPLASHSRPFGNTLGHWGSDLLAASWHYHTAWPARAVDGHDRHKPIHAWWLESQLSTWCW